MRRLIINADDFGLTGGVNRAIIEAHRRGVVTSATLMANGDAFDDATRLALNNGDGAAAALGAKQLGVGCHVVLIGGAPLLPAPQVASLLAFDSGPGAKFHTRLSSFARATLLGKLQHDEIVSEVAAQIKKIQRAGVHVSHVDSHKHTHMFPSVGRAVLQAAKECGVRAVRNPFGAPAMASLASAATRPGLWKRYFQVSVMSGFYPQFRRAVAESGLITTDGILGVLETGSLDARSFGAIIESMPEGTWELVCHPGYLDSSLDQTGTRLLASRVRELEVLTSDAARQAIMRKGIQLISLEDLCGVP